MTIFISDPSLRMEKVVSIKLQVCQITNDHLMCALCNYKKLCIRFVQMRQEEWYTNNNYLRSIKNRPIPSRTRLIEQTWWCVFGISKCIKYRLATVRKRYSPISREKCASWCVIRSVDAEPRRPPVCVYMESRYRYTVTDIHPSPAFFWGLFGTHVAHRIHIES